jgi:type II secretory pathway component PulK
LLMVVFIVALLSTVVMGMLQINTEEIQLMQNHVYAAEALATAEAGLEDALMWLRLDKNWQDGFSGKSFNGGSYTVTVMSNTIESEGTTARGFTARVAADFTATGSLVPYTIKIDALRINE